MTTNAVSFALRLTERVDGRATSFDGAYVLDYDPDAHKGGGRITVTRRIGKAMHFADAEAAMELYERASVVRPLRRDGRPNRPLTVYTIEIVPVDGAVA